MRHNIFEFADLVAAEDTAGEVVAFYPEAMSPPPLCAGPLQILQRRGSAGEVYLAWII
mgnify:CR=1 FL=1